MQSPACRGMHQHAAQGLSRRRARGSRLAWRANNARPRRLGRMQAKPRRGQEKTKREKKSFPVSQSRCLAGETRAASLPEPTRHTPLPASRALWLDISGGQGCASSDAAGRVLPVPRVRDGRLIVDPAPCLTCAADKGSGAAARRNGRPESEAAARLPRPCRLPCLVTVLRTSVSLARKEVGRTAGGSTANTGVGSVGLGWGMLCPSSIREGQVPSWAAEVVDWGATMGAPRATKAEAVGE
ncbi:hypothetical protein B0T16DRAFT_5502 [Cercophora newfieldiana]|uniref:Uncharacterized protein n=1 Tax=Cercophora newfieldiana TaxID=92897 RepID=A0AA39YM68_9PEZI|nr:hypothetical protein B0T16DRAFT_5502 [Cercophora newfieldiana]